MNKAEKREDEVKQTRKKLKKEGGYKFFIEPTLNYWKKEPLSALSNFFFGLIIMYLIFCSIQTINNDMIYCDSSNDQYDGKLMLVYNDYVEWVNSNTKPKPINPWEEYIPNTAHMKTTQSEFMPTVRS